MFINFNMRVVRFEYFSILILDDIQVFQIKINLSLYVRYNNIFKCVGTIESN